MRVPLLDLKAQYNTIREEIQNTVTDLFESQMFILGAAVKDLEAAVAKYSNVKFAVGVASGTDALLISLMALKTGAGDYVVTTPYTFFATAGSVSRLGATPVFVDIEPDTYNISPERLSECLDHLQPQEKIKAIIPVHLYGQCADMDPILATARRYGVPVIEDAAQAIGSRYKNRVAGSMGDGGCFSFFPSKNLGGFGDGGMVTTDNEELAHMVGILRVHGSEPKYYHKVIGCNSRLDALQAAVLSVKLKYLDSWTEARRKNADYYRRIFREAGLADVIKLPTVREENHHIYNQFVIRVEERDALRDFLTSQEIGTEIYYPVPLHLQECYSTLGYKEGNFPESEKAARETLALPIYAELSTAQQDYIADKITEFYRR
ncbi:MAG: DegT/DnrJ/EryC1/StrS family aminotransferase [Deltaproteobacteria bacterium]|nr:DegT/DnrJ/EryC1/StrS family aminotransferase [Deltaproteobacteria bacterium]